MHSSHARCRTLHRILRLDFVMAGALTFLALGAPAITEAQDPAGAVRAIIQDVGQANDLLRALRSNVGVAQMPGSGGLLPGCCPQPWDSSRGELRSARTAVADAIRSYSSRLDRTSLRTLEGVRSRVDRLITTLDGLSTARDRTLIQRTMDASLSELSALANDLAMLEAKFGAQPLVYRVKEVGLWVGPDPLNPYSLSPGEPREFNVRVETGEGGHVALTDVIVDFWASGQDLWVFSFPASMTLQQGQVMDTTLSITAAAAATQNSSVSVKARVRTGSTPQYSGEEAWMMTGILVSAAAAPSGNSCSTSTAKPTISTSTSSMPGGTALTVTLSPGCDPVSGAGVVVYLESDNTTVLDPPVTHIFSSNTSKTITVTAGTPSVGTTVRLRVVRGTASSDWVPVTVLSS